MIVISNRLIEILYYTCKTLSYLKILHFIKNTLFCDYCVILK